MGILLAMIALLAASPINTDRSTRHMIALGIPFTLALVAPTLLTRWRGERVIDWRFLPRRFSWRDIIYTALSVPLAWAMIAPSGSMTILFPDMTQSPSLPTWLHAARNTPFSRARVVRKFSQGFATGVA